MFQSIKKSWVALKTLAADFIQAFWPSVARKRVRKSEIRKHEVLIVECLEKRLAPAVVVTTVDGDTGFPGIKAGDTDNPPATPPDTSLAVGPSDVIEVTNGFIAFYNKNTGAKLHSESLTTFFGTDPGTDGFFDPSVTYDDQANRFVVVALTVDNAAKTSFLNAAFLDGLDPLGFDAERLPEWHRIDVGQTLEDGTMLAADFPRLGWNADAYVVTLAMTPYPLERGGAEALGQIQVLAIEKNSTRDNDVFSITTYRRPHLADFKFGSITPATMHDSTVGGPMWLVREFNNGVIDIIKMTSVLTSEPEFVSNLVNVDNFSLPPSAGQLGPEINTGDERILNADWRDNRLVAGHNIGTGDEIVHARWYEFNTLGAAPTVTQQGTIPSSWIDPVSESGLALMNSY